MKLIRLKLASLLTAFLFVCMSSSGQASPLAYVVAGIDYSSLSLSFSGNGSITSESFESYAEVAGKMSVTDALDAYVESDTAAAWGETNVNDTGMAYQDLYAGAFVEMPAAFDYAYAQAGYNGQFQAETEGTLTISMEYYFTVDITAGMGDAAWTTAAALLGIADEVKTDVFDFTSYDGLIVEDYESPWLTMAVSYDLEAGNLVEFQALAMADAAAAPVPVPGTGLLLGAGLFVIVAIRKKQA